MKCRWVKLEFSGNTCKITLDDGSVLKGIKENDLKEYYYFSSKHNRSGHYKSCEKLFGDYHQRNLEIISKIVGMEITAGSFPESDNAELFLKRYFEKIESEL